MTLQFYYRKKEYKYFCNLFHRKCEDRYTFSTNKQASNSDTNYKISRLASGEIGLEAKDFLNNDNDDNNDNNDKNDNDIDDNNDDNDKANDIKYDEKIQDSGMKSITIVAQASIETLDA